MGGENIFCLLHNFTSPVNLTSPVIFTLLMAKFHLIYVLSCSLFTYNDIIVNPKFRLTFSLPYYFLFHSPYNH